MIEGVVPYSGIRISRLTRWNGPLSCLKGNLNSPCLPFFLSSSGIEGPGNAFVVEVSPL